MSDNLKLTSLDSKDDSPTFNKPEKMVGWGVFLLLAGIFFYNADTILALLLDGTYALILGVVLIAFIALMMDKNIQRAIFFAFKMFTRSIAGTVINMNPIAIMQITIDELNKMRQKLIAQINNVAKQEGEVSNELVQNKNKIEELVMGANQAQKMGHSDIVSLNMIEAAGLKDFNDKLLKMQADTRNVLTFLKKTDKAADYHIKELGIKVRQQEKQAKIINATHGALKTAVRLFKGTTDENYAFMQASDALQRDMGEKIGEIKMAMEMSESFIKGADVKNAVYEQKGLDMLEKFNKGELKLFTDANHVPLDQQNISSQLNMAKPIALPYQNNNANDSNPYGDLLT